MDRHKTEDIRVLLSHIESEMSMWAKGYKEITQRQLDQFLRTFQKTIILADDAEMKEKLQTIILQLESVQDALLRSESGDHQLAQQIISTVHELRRARTSDLKPVEIEEAVGAHVIYFHYSLSTIGQIVRFRPASREQRAFGFIGEVIIRPADDQEIMKALFHGVYPAQNDAPFLFDLYHWPADFPPPNVSGARTARRPSGHSMDKPSGARGRRRMGRRSNKPFRRDNHREDHQSRGWG
jgi:hypothetical protein